MGTPGYMYDHHRLPLQNSFEDVELPVRVEIEGVASYRITDEKSYGKTVAYIMGKVPCPMLNSSK